jgi:hypothetical protein
VVARAGSVPGRTAAADAAPVHVLVTVFPPAPVPTSPGTGATAGGGSLRTPAWASALVVRAARAAPWVGGSAALLLALWLALALRRRSPLP